MQLAQRQSRAFLSYQRRDEECAKEIAGLLRSQSIDTFLDIEARSLRSHVGGPILRALFHADALVLLLSHSTLEARWAPAELAEAQRHNLPIATLRLEPCPIPRWIGPRVQFELYLERTKAVERLAHWIVRQPKRRA